MPRVNAAFQKIKETVGALSPTVKVTLGILAMILLVGLALWPTLRILLALALMGVLAILWPPPSPPIWPPEILLQALCLSMYQVLRDSARQLSAIPPTYQNEIIHNPPYRVIGEAVVCTFDIYKQTTALTNTDELRALVGVLQSRLEKHFSAANALQQQWYLNGGSEVCLQIIGIDDEGATLAVHVVLAYDVRTFQGGQKYMAQLRRAENSLRASAVAVQSPDHTPSIPLAYNKTLWAEGVSRPVVWPYEQAPHAVVIGATGSGKTYLVKQIIHQTLKSLPGAAVILCDFKADDFRFLLGREGYYQYTDCAEGLRYFYDLFSARQSGEDVHRDFRLLVFDEWASYLQSLDKKQAEGEMKRMAMLLMLGRSFGCHVLVSQQRGDAQYFSTARDNFGMVIALGNLSPESRDMFFKGYKEKIELTQTQGTGYAAVNGGEPIAVQVRTVNMDKIETEIAQHFTPKPSDDAGEA